MNLYLCFLATICLIDTAHVYPSATGTSTKKTHKYKHSNVYYHLQEISQFAFTSEQIQSHLAFDIMTVVQQNCGMFQFVLFGFDMFRFLEMFWRKKSFPYLTFICFTSICHIMSIFYISACNSRFALKSEMGSSCHIHSCVKSFVYSVHSRA